MYSETNTDRNTQTNRKSYKKLESEKNRQACREAGMLFSSPLG